MVPHQPYSSLLQDQTVVDRKSFPTADILAVMLCVVCFLAVGVTAGEATPVTATPVVTEGGDLIFADDLESGNTTLWSNAVGLVPPDVFRFTDLDLRDPHVFVDLSPLCLDFTDTPIPLTDISFNDNLQVLLNSDEDMDGLVDLGLLLLFRPLDVLAMGEQVDFQAGDCNIDGSGCDTTPDTAPAVLTYDGIDTGTCLDVLGGTTSGYSPVVTPVAGPCFTTVAETLVVDLLGIPVTLQEGQIAGTFVGDPVTTLSPGLMRGFLSETDADSILIPADLPIIGGQPFSVLLPGGTNNCAPGDDRDMLDGVSGWWFYFQVVGQEVVFTGN